MTLTLNRVLFAALMLATAVCARQAMGQVAPSASPEPAPQLQSSPLPSTLSTEQILPLGNAAPAVPSAVSTAPRPLFDFQDSDIKFSLSSMMNTLRDSRHEGWVLAAYPDPKTSRPLIGAGFGLDVATTEHPQRDPLNPHPFIEPSTAQLWQAAGLDSARLQAILDQFDRS